MEPLQPIQAKSVSSFGLVWLATVIAAVVIFPVVSGLFINYYKTEDPAWIDLLYRQKQIALQRVSSQPHRLIIVGGSGALFGIDAELVEKKLHIPTVNFATHAGLGLRYLLDRVRRELQPGDIVLVSAEYETWADTYRDTEGPAFDYIFTYDRSYLARMNPLESAKMIVGVPWSQWLRSAQGWLERFNGEQYHFRKLSFYSVATLDRSGDIHVTSPSTNAQPASFFFPADPALPAVQSIKEFGTYAKSRSIQLLWTWPAMARPAVVSPPPEFLSGLLRSSGFTILDEPLDNTFPPDWFMDTPYHPDPSCRRIRTEELIRRLRPFLGLPSAPEKATGLFLLVGKDHELTAGNLFAHDPGVLFRYLGHHSDSRSISPERVAQLVRGGTPIYTDSDEAKPLLESAGLTVTLQSNLIRSVPQWFNRYPPSSIFCIAAAAAHSFDPIWKTAVPDTVYQRLSSGFAAAAIFTSGVAPVVSTKIDSQPLDQLFPHPNAIPCVISLQTNPAQIAVDEREFVASPTGICVVAIDPEMGIVLGKAIFDSRPSIELWRIYRVVPKSPPPI